MESVGFLNVSGGDSKSALERAGKVFLYVADFEDIVDQLLAECEVWHRGGGETL